MKKLMELAISNLRKSYGNFLKKTVLLIKMVIYCGESIDEFNLPDELSVH